MLLGLFSRYYIHLNSHLGNTNQLSRMSVLSQLAEMGVPARQVLGLLAPDFEIPTEATTSDIWAMIASIVEPPRRKKLPQYNTIEDAINLIKSSSKILVLSGAGISTSAGLPDFRSRNGIYIQIHEQHPDLSDPKSIFDIDYFRQNPSPFYQFAKALFPGQFKPTVGHQFIKCLEDHKKLLRNYSQNIDTLEKQAGIKRVVECHGSFATASCTSCKYSIDGDGIKTDVFEQRVPKCPRCLNLDGGPVDGLGVMKPDIVFFGEQLGKEFHDSLDTDKDGADLLIVIGSSLKVRPVALIPRTVSASIPQILINREPLDHMSFDIELLGDCDHIIQELCLRLGDGWTHLCDPELRPLKQIDGPSVLKMAEKQDNSQSDAVTNTTDSTSENDNKEVAIDDCNGRDGDESDWEDVEVLDDETSSIDDKVDLIIPNGSFVHLRPNKYFFRGAELTRDQFEVHTSLNQDTS